jgi:hypothetical protein
MSRKISSIHGADLRQGVSEVQHELLDLIEANALQMALLASRHLVETGSKDAAAALRANPETGNGRRRRAKALEAAARLILAVEAMDAGR